MIEAIGHWLTVSGTMGWHILWALVLGFALSAIVQAVVRRDAVSTLMGDAGPRSLAAATGLGVASSSCSYAAVALARSLFRKGADFTAAVAFQIASTNLVIELGIVLALLLGWQFTLAEYAGGLIMIVLVAVALRLVVSRQLVDEAHDVAEHGWAGSMEGHAAMDMSVGGDGSFVARLTSAPGRTAVAAIFVMEWAAVLRDIVIGLLVAGAVAAWVPDTFWQSLFLVDHPTLSALWGPIVAPLVAIGSFVCSVGNVPLAGVLWNGGISFGGVVSFLFADLIIIPILLIYAKYYGRRMTVRLTIILYATMVAAGYVVEVIFGAAGLVPDQRAATVGEAAGITWNYTTVLNLLFLLLAGYLVLRFVRDGNAEMLRHMHDPPQHAPAES